MKEFDGSRRHVLDWVESADFVTTIQHWIAAQNLTVSSDSKWMPKSWDEPDESKLFDPRSHFLSENEKAEFKRWWLAHPQNANTPNWDVIVPATTASGGRGLILIEAKAHINEFDCKPKPLRLDPLRDNQRSIDNHDQIGRAIAEAGNALAFVDPMISISHESCYQLSNRIAMAWKLASMGIQTSLIFLGFTGDSEIAKAGVFFDCDDHWQKEFDKYVSFSFPRKLIDTDIHCGASSFRLMAKSLPVTRLSRAIADRRMSRLKEGVGGNSAADQPL